MTAAIAITEVVPPRALPTGPGAPLEVLDDPLEFDACTRWETAADGRQLAESRLQLSGLYCAACADTIEQALQAVVGVQAVSVVAATQRATVRWDPSRTRLSTLIRAVQAAGYDGVPDLAAPAHDIGDGELLHAAWQRWGTQCADRLRGDFAFVIWNPRHQTLYAARDPMGVRPFVFHFVAGKLFVFGSTVEAVLAQGDVPAQMDEGRIADALFAETEGIDLSTTFYRAVTFSHAHPAT